MERAEIRQHGCVIAQANESFPWMSIDVKTLQKLCSIVLTGICLCFPRVLQDAVFHGGSATRASGSDVMNYRYFLPPDP